MNVDWCMYSGEFFGGYVLGVKRLWEGGWGVVCKVWVIDVGKWKFRV